MRRCCENGVTLWAKSLASGGHVSHPGEGGQSQARGADITCKPPSVTLFSASCARGSSREAAGRLLGPRPPPMNRLDPDDHVVPHPLPLLPTINLGSPF